MFENVLDFTKFFSVLAKGRTNVELREQFTLAAGVSQSVVGFTSKMSKTSAASPTSSVSGEGRNGVSGPITKVSTLTLKGGFLGPPLRNPTRVQKSSLNEDLGL